MNVYDWYKDNTEYCNDEEQPEMNYIVTEHKTPREQAAFWMAWSLLRSKQS
jgi:hypothetical protein